jgi:hypothetical protein
MTRVPRLTDGPLGGFVLTLGTHKIALPPYMAEHEVRLLEEVARAAFLVGFNTGTSSAVKLLKTPAASGEEH